MPSFYKLVPPPREKEPFHPDRIGYLIRADYERNYAGGKWLAVACAILCLSIVVALGGALGGRSVRAASGFLPVSSGRAAAPPAQDNRVSMRFPTATDPLGWTDLTLMLRTGLSDDEIIAAIATKQLTVPIGAAQEGELRALGAGQRLLANLRARRLYAAPVPAFQGVAAAPRVSTVALPVTASRPPAASYAAAVDYAARDLQIASLQARIGDLDERIRRIRTNPDRYWYGRDYGVDRQQGMDRYLSQLDKERNDLRRQKWQLEGR